MPAPATIVKRDGREAAFDVGKIRAALLKASVRDVSAATDAVVADPLLVPTVEGVQDAVERALMRLGDFDAAKRYILFREQRRRDRSAFSAAAKHFPAVSPPWDGLGETVFLRTYARPRPDGTLESLSDTVGRVLEACQTQFHVGFTADELADFYGLLMRLKGSVAGRVLWQAGTKTVERLGLASTQNCAFVKVDGPVLPFVWAFDMLALGSGVGFSVETRHIEKIPSVLDADVDVARLDTRDASFIVPDSREGWVRLLRQVLEAFFVTGESFSYSTVLLRGRGSKIAGFGGVASGPEALCTGIAQICGVLRRCRGRRLSSVDALDIMCIIGSIVVAGNVRRSAMVALGSPDDLPYLRAKRWDLGPLPSWRAMSNNSVVCEDVAELPDEFWDGYRGNGEPYGLFNLRLSRAVGRLADGDRYPDPSVEGANPCVEQGLADKETCCLAELFLPRVESYDELRRLAEYLYRVNKHVLTLPSHWPQTTAVIRRNMRMGIGISGWAMSTAEQLSWLDPLYRHLREYDAAYSAARGLPPSVKLTTVKPSGSLSLLAGVTPGAHPAIYPFFIRRVRFAADSPLLARCREAGYRVEAQRNFDGSTDHGTQIVEFPCRFPAHARLARDMSATDQLETVRWLQTHWSDNAVSVTVYMRPGELEGIKAWLRDNYRDSVKSVSFLLHSDHNFDQPPYEEITEEEYMRLVSACRGLGGGPAAAGGDDVLEPDCPGGACPAR